MRINHNIPALNTTKNLTMNNQSLTNTPEKLASGLKNNRASDVAAELAISEDMRGKLRGLT